ncbi:hypothetical protein H5410_026919 [Solanum commersonii]|uniref:Uncharacterized protein n=1 Tax=Solanum commersonii TaxID=4109 RepID=A0A9J5YXJ2_SOLCO|nr:hypothetical protein H5410_026919 [Solanum commersonii]
MHHIWSVIKVATVEEDVLMLFVAKFEIAKEDALSVVRHQIHNYQRRCMICDSSSNLQKQNKMQ